MKRCFFGEPEKFECEDNVKVLEAIEDKVKELEHFVERLRIHSVEITGLRDGLFNASAVMETRTANRLAVMFLYICCRI